MFCVLKKKTKVKPSSSKPNKGIIHGVLSLTYIMDEVIGNFPTIIGEGSEYARKKLILKPMSQFSKQRLTKWFFVG